MITNLKKTIPDKTWWVTTGTNGTPISGGSVFGRGSRIGYLMTGGRSDDGKGGTSLTEKSQVVGLNEVTVKTLFDWGTIEGEGATRNWVEGGWGISCGGKGNGWGIKLGVIGEGGGMEWGIIGEGGGIALGWIGDGEGIEQGRIGEGEGIEPGFNGAGGGIEDVVKGGGKIGAG